MLHEEGHLQADDEICSASREFSHVTAAPEVSFVSLDGCASSQGRTLPLVSLQPCKPSSCELLSAVIAAEELIPPSDHVVCHVCRYCAQQ